MIRPLFRWLLFALCLTVLLGAMLWISARTLDLEDARRHAAEEAQVQERIRLALWRMDSLASSLLIRENARPASHYQAFYAPEDLFDNRGANALIPKGRALQPSPLFADPPDLVLLHFEMVTGIPFACSPQVPMGNQAQLANQWYSRSPQSEGLSPKLTQVTELLKRHPELQNQPKLPIQPPAQPKVSATAPSTDIPIDQWMANSREASQRSKIVSQNMAMEKLSSSNTNSRRGMLPSPPPANQTNDTESRQTAVTPAMPESAGDLQPTWLEGELLLLRRASLDGRERLQGVWLDWPTLRKRLLETVADLLPAGSLAPGSPQEMGVNANALVTLPVKLIPGVVPIQINGAKSALKPALAIAWICVLLAALAIGFVLHRAMLLSERRGAFVSSVTHELRTPLTTFRLYSEMLAEDMVPDADQRRNYLQTLCDESTRLMHLVENVLAYSRIERGRTAARLETLTVDDLLQRLLPRLRQRAEQVSLELISQCPPEVAAARVRADALAVEQILFNLVDNACKYAAPDSDPRRLELTAAATAKGVTLELRDFGPGLSEQARKKLFRPFAKSATEAAHSAPGVGLGLALCRRLARDLGGDLVSCTAPPRGACFRLSLVRA